MKHDKHMRAALDAALLRLNMDLPEEKRLLLLDHLALVINKNHELNLTRITTPEEAIILHIEDSLSIYKEFSQRNGAFCDVGTGAGYPGIPLGIVSERYGVLIDSVKKKARATQDFVDMLGLNSKLTVRGVRSEELCKDRGKSIDTVVMRAVSSLASLEEIASPLLKMGGQLVAMKGIISDNEYEQARRASRPLGMELVSYDEFTIGDGTYERSVVVFEKIDKPHVKLPRNPGMAQRHPLGR